jgi:hypothetical protein
MPHTTCCYKIQALIENSAGDKYDMKNLDDEGLWNDVKTVVLVTITSHK